MFRPSQAYGAPAQHRPPVCTPRFDGVQNAPAESPDSCVLRQSRPEVLGAKRQRSQSARPEAPERVLQGARQAAVATWQIKVGHKKSGVLVRPMLEAVMARLRAGPWSRVEVWLAGMAQVHNPQSGVEQTDLSLVTPIIEAYAGAGQVQAALGEAVQAALAAVLRQVPRAQSWRVAGVLDADGVVRTVEVCCGGRRCDFQLHIAPAGVAHHVGSFAGDQIATRLSDGETLWHLNADDAPAAWADQCLGAYTVHTRALHHVLEKSWRARASGLVPGAPDTDTPVWQAFVAQGRFALPAALDRLAASMPPERSALVLANALLSAQAQAKSRGQAGEACVTLVRGRLHAALNARRLMGSEVVLQSLLTQETSQALGIWAYSFALPNRLGHAADDSAAPCMARVARHDDGDVVQLRLRLGPGRFITPTFDQGALASALPKPAARLTHVGAAPWSDARQALRLCAALLGDENLMGLWHAAALPTDARRALAVKRLGALADRAPASVQWQLRLVAQTLAIGTTLRLDPALFADSMPPATVVDKLSAQVLAALWTRQLSDTAAWSAHASCPLHLAQALRHLTWLEARWPLDRAPGAGAALADMLTETRDVDRAAHSAWTALVGAVLAHPEAKTHAAQLAPLLVHAPHDASLRQLLVKLLDGDDAAGCAAAGRVVAQAACASAASARAVWTYASLFDVARWPLGDDACTALIGAQPLHAASPADVHTLCKLLLSLQAPAACLATLSADKALYRALHKQPQTLAALGKLWLAMPDPPQAAVQTWYDCALQTLPRTAREALLDMAAPGQVLRLGLVRAACTREKTALEVWHAFVRYSGAGAPSGPPWAGALRAFAEATGAMCRRMTQLGCEAWHQHLVLTQQVPDARTVLAETYARYDQCSERDKSVATRLTLLGLRTMLQDTQPVLVDLAAMGHMTLLSPPLLTRWSQHMLMALEAAADAPEPPPQHVLQTLRGVMQLPYAPGRTTATHVVDMASQMLLCLVHWGQVELAQEALVTFGHHLGGRSFVHHVERCTTHADICSHTSDALAAVMPVHMATRVVWLHLLRNILNDVADPYPYVSLVEGHVRAALTQLSEAQARNRTRRDAEPPSAVMGTATECDAEAAAEVLWAEVMQTCLAIERISPLSAQSLLEVRLTETVSLAGMDAAVYAFIWQTDVTGRDVRLQPLWRAWVYSAQAAAERGARAQLALRVWGIALDAPLIDQVLHQREPTAAHAVPMLVCDLADALVGRETTSKSQLVRFDDIAHMVIATGQPMFRWWQLTNQGCGGLCADAAKQRLGVLATLVMQTSIKQPVSPIFETFFGRALGFYARHTLVAASPLLARNAGRVLCAYAMQQRVDGLADWRDVLSDLNAALVPAQMHLGDKLAALQALVESGVGSAYPTSLQRPGVGTDMPPPSGQQIALQLAHPEVRWVKAGFTAYLLFHVRMGQQTAAEQAAVYGNLVRALRHPALRALALAAIEQPSMRQHGGACLRSVLAALQDAVPWNDDDARVMARVLTSVAKAGADPALWAPCIARISASLSKSAYFAPCDALEEAQTRLRTWPFLVPLADALKAALAR